MDDLKEFIAPKNMADLRDLLAQSVVDVRAGRVDPKVANSISYLAAGLVRIFEANQRQELTQTGPQRNAFEVFKAAWLRAKESRWAEELEQQYAGQSSTAQSELQQF